jgi:hypothetical protein
MKGLSARELSRTAEIWSDQSTSGHFFINFYTVVAIKLVVTQLKKLVVPRLKILPDELIFKIEKVIQVACDNIRVCFWKVFELSCEVRKRCKIWNTSILMDEKWQDFRISSLAGFCNALAHFARKLKYFPETNSYVITSHLNHFFYFENQLVGEYLQSGHNEFFQLGYDEFYCNNRIKVNEKMSGCRLVTPDFCGSGEFPGGKTFHFKIGFLFYVFVEDKFGSLVYKGCANSIGQFDSFSRAYHSSYSFEFAPSTWLVYSQATNVFHNQSEVQTYAFYTILPDPVHIAKFNKIRYKILCMIKANEIKPGFVPVEVFSKF